MSEGRELNRYLETDPVHASQNHSVTWLDGFLPQDRFHETSPICKDRSRRVCRRDVFAKGNCLEGRNYCNAFSQVWAVVLLNDFGGRDVASVGVSFLLSKVGVMVTAPTLWVVVRTQGCPRGSAQSRARGVERAPRTRQALPLPGS